MHNGITQNNEVKATNPSSSDGEVLVVQNGSTTNLEAALMAIGNAGFGKNPIKISVITLEINTNHN